MGGFDTTPKKGFGARVSVPQNTKETQMAFFLGVGRRKFVRYTLRVNTFACDGELSSNYCCTHGGEVCRTI